MAFLDGRGSQVKTSNLSLRLKSKSSMIDSPPYYIYMEHRCLRTLTSSPLQTEDMASKSKPHPHSSGVWLPSLLRGLLDILVAAGKNVLEGS